MEGLDKIDLKILHLLQEDARISQSEIAERVGLTVSSTHERIKKLEKRGVIKKYTALAEAEALGKPLLAFIRLSIQSVKEDYYPGVGERVKKLCSDEPDILECHHVAGEDCYILKVRASSPKGLERLLGRILTGSSAIRSVTNIVFSTIKESTIITSAEKAEEET